MDSLLDALPSGLGAMGIVVALLLTTWFLNRRPDAVSHRFRNQMLMIGLTAVAGLAILPPDNAAPTPETPEASPEQVVFDKADGAEEAHLLETEYRMLCERIVEVQGQMKGAPSDIKAELEVEMEELQGTRVSLEERIAREKAALEES